MTMSVQRPTMRQRRCLSGLATALTCGLATIACAEVHVEGSPSAVRVTTSQDAVSHVLSAFSATFNVRYRTAIPLDARALATYSGSFGQVISRLLDGYNYVIKTERNSIEVLVFGRRGRIAAPHDLRAADSILSRWR